MSERQVPDLSDRVWSRTYFIHFYLRRCSEQRELQALTTEIGFRWCEKSAQVARGNRSVRSAKLALRLAAGLGAVQEAIQLPRVREFLNAHRGSFLVTYV